MTLREAINRIAITYQHKRSWARAIEVSKRKDILDKELKDINPRTIVSLEKEVVGIGHKIVMKLLELHWEELED